MAEGSSKDVDSFAVSGPARDATADRSEDLELNSSGGMSLVDFCVQLDDCTPTVRFLYSLK